MNTFRTLFKLRPYIQPHIHLTLVSGLLAFPLSGLRVAPALLVKYLIDDLLINRDATQLPRIAAAVAGVFVINFPIRFFHYYLIRIVSLRAYQKIKSDLYRHLLGLSADYFTEKNAGHYISRISSDPMYVDGAVRSINSVIREPITFIALFSYVLYLDWKLTLVTLVTAPLLAWVFAASGRNFRRYIERISEENANVFSTIQETLTGIRIIKIFRLEDYVKRKFGEKLDRYISFNLKTAALEEASHPAVELLNGLAIVVFIYYGGSLVLKNEMTPGDLLSFFTAFALMIDPIRRMNELNIKLHQAATGVNRIFEVFEWKSRLHLAENPQALPKFSHQIEFDHVSFAYPDSLERKVLNDVHFTVPKGRVIALVGKSGSGKSSLVNLLPRLYDVTTGSIRIDGKDIRELNLSDLRKQISVVSQDVFLFNDTIEENIRCGNQSAIREQILKAAQRAYAEDFIKTLPKGFDTVIGDRGLKLSGGERQRISIARAFLAEAPILILDEATSNLDTASERAVQTALEELMRDRTTIVIAHRLSTIQRADEIIVMKDGRIVETGRHEELIARQGEYFRLHKVDA